MLQIRRETDYAIRCIYYLAGKENEVIMADEISHEMKMPGSFTAKILQKLSRAGFVESTLGIRGGFSLSKSPHQISLYDIIVAIEGPIAMNRCTVDKRSCNLSRTCRIHPIWIDVRREIEQILKNSNFQKIRASVG